jgi:phosphatidylglycerophosphatase B
MAAMDPDLDDTPRPPRRRAIARLARVLLPAAALLPAAYVVPGLDPFRAPRLDLAGTPAVIAYWVAQSAEVVALSVLGLALTALVVLRPGTAWRERTAEAFVILAALGAFLGGGAYLNEHHLKPRFGVFRPNILELASPPEAPALGMSAEDFYALADKDTRRAHLRRVLAAESVSAVRLAERVREHWIEEAGFAFPSGHSLAAMSFATFFLALALSRVSGSRRRLWAFYALVPWALAVCYSRPLLRVHSPADITAGGLAGVALGLVAFASVEWILAREAREPAGTRS